MTVSRSVSLIGLAMIGAIWHPMLCAEEGTPDKAKEHFASMVEKIRVASLGDSARPFTLERQPALSWSNPARQTTAGALFFWTRRGRPQVALCLYPSSEEVIDLEFQSLSDEQLSAQSGGQTLWNPAEAGVQWGAVPASVLPHRSAFQRLRQMRQMARQFTAKLVPPSKNPIELRLLDTPVYRYALDSSKESSRDGVIDGAVFAFVQGTDPEVLLMLEAVRDGDQVKWRYALARMSIVPTQVRLSDTLVWETEWAIQRPHTPYFVYKSF